MPDDTEATTGGVSEISAQLAQLTDLFRRRLADDKSKQRQLEELYVQLNFSRDALSGMFLRPLIEEALIVADRVALGGEVDPMTESVVDEMMEIFRRRGLRELHAEGPFDPQIHEAVEIEDLESPDLHGQVLATRRSGFALGDLLLRPAQVVVGQFAQTDDSAPTDRETVSEDVVSDAEPTSTADLETEAQQ